MLPPRLRAAGAASIEVIVDVNPARVFVPLSKDRSPYFDTVIDDARQLVAIGSGKGGVEAGAGARGVPGTSSGGRLEPTERAGVCRSGRL
jgi:hypothetical protein